MRKDPAFSQHWRGSHFHGNARTRPDPARRGSALRSGFFFVVVGLFGGDITLPLPFIPMRAMTIQGSYVGSLGELTELLALVTSAHIPSIPITRRPLDDADAALQDLRAGRLIGRAVLMP